MSGVPLRTRSNATERGDAGRLSVRLLGDACCETAAGAPPLRRAVAGDSESRSSVRRNSADTSCLSCEKRHGGSGRAASCSLHGHILSTMSHRLLRPHRRVHASLSIRTSLCKCCALRTLQVNAGVCRKCGTASKDKHGTAHSSSSQEIVRLKNAVEQFHHHTIRHKSSSHKLPRALPRAHCRQQVAAGDSPDVATPLHAMPKPQACLQQSKVRAFNAMLSNIWGQPAIAGQLAAAVTHMSPCSRHDLLQDLHQ